MCNLNVSQPEDHQLLSNDAAKLKIYGANAWQAVSKVTPVKY